jgi:hypothetical protein
MDQESVTGVWEDLLYDGHDHQHGAGGLMLNGASFGTHVEYDGDFPVHLVRDSGGAVTAFSVDLDPYRDDLDSLRRPHGWSDEHEHEHEHGHGHGHEDGHEDGWSAPERVTLVSNQALLGDPAALPQADNTGGLLTLNFPASAGTLAVSVLTQGRVRRYLTAAWTPGA